MTLDFQINFYFLRFGGKVISERVFCKSQILAQTRPRFCMRTEEAHRIWKPSSQKHAWNFHCPKWIWDLITKSRKCSNPQKTHLKTMSRKIIIDHWLPLKTCEKKSTYALKCQSENGSSFPLGSTGIWKSPHTCPSGQDGMFRGIRKNKSTCNRYILTQNF